MTHRRIQIRQALVFFVVCLFIPVAHAGDKRPNIIVITADDYGRDAASLYNPSNDRGPTAPTPALAKLAAQGIVLDNAWAMPQCSTTRGTISYGRLPSRSGLGQVVGRFTVPGTPSELNLDDPTLLPRLMQKNGYTTAMFGKWHQNQSGPDAPNLAGYDMFLGGLAGGTPTYTNWTGIRNGEEVFFEEFHGKVMVNETIKFMKEQKAAGRPTFIWLSFFEPHFRFVAAPREDLHPVIHAGVIQEVIDAWGGEYPEADTQATNQEQRWAGFKSMIAFMDVQIGRLLKKVDLDNTYVIFAGDNGTQGQGIFNATEPPFNPARAKSSLYRGGMEVPFIVAGPRFKKGYRSYAPVTTTDIYATALDMAGIEKPSIALESYVMKDLYHASGKPRKYNTAELFMATPAVGGLRVDATVNGPFARPLEGRTVSDGRFHLVAETIIENDQVVCNDGSLAPPDCINARGIYDKKLELRFYDNYSDPFQDNNLLDDLSQLTTEQKYGLRAHCEEIHRISRQATYFQNGKICTHDNFGRY